MKTFHTSNYDRDGANPLAVAISYKPPEDYAGAVDVSLAPTKALLDEYHDDKITDDQYAKDYIALIESRGVTAQSVIDRYPEGTIFLCYDYKDGSANRCHRFILADYLMAGGAVDVPELRYSIEAKLDSALEETFPASDPVSADNFT